MNDPVSAGSLDPTARLMRLLGGKWLTAAISSAASLGIVEALSTAPMTLDRLAEAIDCKSDSLHRLMRVLAGEGIVSLNGSHEYALTETGALLREGHFADLARFVGSPFGWDPWSKLPHAVRSGESSFARHHGEELFPYLEHHADDAAIYHAAIDAFCRREARAVAKAFDFSGIRRIADIGGGRGTLLVEVLSAWDHLSGVLLERPAVVDDARKAFSESGLENRCEARVGDFFVELPEDADLCVLMHIVHSWDDATATGLLRRCADAVGPTGKVLVIEGVLLPEGHQNQTSLLDLEMLVLCGPGHERTKPQMRRLLSSAGLRVVETKPLAETAHLFIAEPKTKPPA